MKQTRRNSFALHSLWSCVLLLLTLPCLADDWPVERGDVRGSGVARSLLPEKPVLLWKKTLDAAIDATCVIANGVIYVGDGDGTFYALQLSDSELIWKKTFNAGFQTAAAVDEGRVFVGDYDGMFRALDAKTGKVLWSFEAEAEFYAGPNVYQESVLTTSEDGSLYCLNKKTGEMRWKYSIDSPLRCLPTVGNEKVALAGCDAKLHIVGVQQGETIATLKIDGQTGSTPAMLGSRVYFGTRSGVFHCLETKEKETAPIQLAWTFHDPKRRQPISTSAAVTQQLAIYGSEGKHFYAIDATSGTLKWKAPIKTGVSGGPVIVGNRVFFATVRGKLFALDIANGKETWHYKAGGKFAAAPAVAEERLVLGNDDGVLFCFGKAEKGQESRD